MGSNLKTSTHRRQSLIGTVVSDKMQKTLVVKVNRRVKEPIYKKYITRSKRFKVHDEENKARIGDKVKIIETRPLSKDKRWNLESIIRREGVISEHSSVGSSRHGTLPGIISGQSPGGSSEHSSEGFSRHGSLPGTISEHSSVGSSRHGSLPGTISGHSPEGSSRHGRLPGIITPLTDQEQVL